MKHTKQVARLTFKWHGWVGLTAGIFFLLFGLTGSLLMFRHTLDRWCNPELHHLQAGNGQVSIDSIYRMIAHTHPNLKKIVLHDFPQDAYDSYEFMVYKNQQSMTENYLYFIFVDPYTGSILKEGSYQEITPSFFRWLYSFHYSLQLGFPGKLLTAVMAMCMLLSLFTGMIVYRKSIANVFRFRISLRFSNWRTGSSSLHRVVGVWALFFNAVLFLTGFLMNKESFSPASWTLYAPHENHLVAADIDSLVNSACSWVKGFQPIAVNIPTEKGMPVLVRGHVPSTSFFLFQGKASSLAFDPETGQLKNIGLIHQQPVGDKIDWAIYQLHIGSYGGSTIRWLYALLGLTPGLLAITGAVLWFKRR